jgi:hypothetical protein
MQFDCKVFHFDCWARHVKDGHYVAVARITCGPAQRRFRETHDSGDIDSVVNGTDAISCARAWAIEWRDENSD